MAKQGVYGPKPRPLLGNLKDIASLLSETASDDMSSINHDIVGRLMPQYVVWSKQYGKRFMYWNGCEPRLCLTEGDLIKEFLTKYNSVSGRSWQQLQGSKHFVGGGLLMANGQNWYHQRQIVAKAFTGDKLKVNAGYVVECTKQTIQKLEKEIEESSGQIEFEIGEHLARLTADIISRAEFGCSHEKGKRIFDLLTLLQRRAAQATRNLYLPGSRFFPSKYNKGLKALKLEVERQLVEIIQGHKDTAEIGRGNSYGNDLLSMLLNEMQKNRDDGFGLNLSLLLDECKTFFFAGHETTAILLTWTIMLLASNPDWQDKVREEVASVCHGDTPSIDHLSKLTLLGMVINESMRLYPPALFIPKVAFQDMELGDLHIPKGLSIWIPNVVINHNKEIWGEDANEFNPGRFAARPLNTNRYFAPFSSGPRTCVGQAFAIIEAKIILSMLVSRFRFTISKNYRHAPVIVITVKPQYGVQVCLERLNS
ncbi:Cytochrome P450 [Dillenia turbinata]|uniref:Cytochrome P450 n=1 Tax=Dillenia turbinata TaxID=194707 RepID=A0AAN8VER1_9MAGN